jgi:amino acid transporter
MARDGLLPHALTHLLPGRGTPWVAIAVTSALSLLLALTGEVAQLASTLVLLLLVVFTSVNLAVLVLRREPVDEDHFRAPTAIPVLGIASCLLLFTQIEAGVWLRGGILIAAGLVLGLVAARTKRRQAEPAAEA